MRDIKITSKQIHTDHVKLSTDVPQNLSYPALVQLRPSVSDRIKVISSLMASWTEETEELVAITKILVKLKITTLV